MSRTNNARNKVLSMAPGAVCKKRPGTSCLYDIFLATGWPAKGRRKPFVSAYNACTAWRFALEKLGRQAEKELREFYSAR